MLRAHSILRMIVHLFQAEHPWSVRMSSKHLLDSETSPDISDVKVLMFCNKENGLSKLVKLSGCVSENL